MALIERCRRGDLGAFEEIYKAHSGKLYSLACRMLGNPTEAEDLLQEIFLSALCAAGDRGRAAVVGRHLFVAAASQARPGVADAGYRVLTT